MRETPAIRINWTAREAALAPLAVAAQAEVSLLLAKRLLAFDDESLMKLKGVAGEQLLIIFGDEGSLPWVDGVTYLGRDESAPSLLLPTTHQPDVPVALFERALLKRWQGAAPLAVLLSPPVVAPVSASRAIARAPLTAWLAKETRL